MIEYWHGTEQDYNFPSTITKFTMKSQTDLYKLLELQTHAVSLQMCDKSGKFALLTSNKKILVYHLLTGKLSRVYDESIKKFVLNYLFDNCFCVFVLSSLKLFVLVLSLSMPQFPFFPYRPLKR